jgi:hypothetical protein
MVEGLFYVIKGRSVVLFLTAIASLYTFAASALTTLFPVFAQTLFDRGPVEVGSLWSMLGVGLLSVPGPYKNRRLEYHTSHPNNYAGNRRQRHRIAGTGMDNTPCDGWRVADCFGRRSRRAHTCCMGCVAGSDSMAHAGPCAEFLYDGRHGSGIGRYYLFWTRHGSIGRSLDCAAIGVVMGGTALLTGLFWSRMSDDRKP